MRINILSKKAHRVCANLIFLSVHSDAVFVLFLEGKGQMLEMRIFIRTCDQAVINIPMYEVETSKDVADESFEILWSISEAERLAQKSIESKMASYSDFQNISCTQ